MVTNFVTVGALAVIVGALAVIVGGGVTLSLDCEDHFQKAASCVTGDVHSFDVSTVDVA